MRGLLLLFFLLILIMIPFQSKAQTLCTPMGSSMYCAGYDREPTTITPFSRNQGVITTPDRTIPYTSLPAPRGGIEPLRSLEPLPTLEMPEPLGFDDDLPLPFSSPGGSLILGE